MKKIEELDTVALLHAIPQKNLSKGQVGTIVAKLNKNIYEIEFTNTKGETILTTPIPEKDFILLRFEVA